MHVSSKLVTFISLFWSTTRIRANIVQVPPDQGWFEGRTLVSAFGEIQFDHSAVAFRFTVANTDTVVAELSQNGPNPAVLQPHYFKVFVDGEFQPNTAGNETDLSSIFSFSTSGAQWREDSDGFIPLVNVVLAKNLSLDSTHDILVFKATEAQFGEIDPTPNYMSLYYIDLTSAEGSDAVPQLTAPSSSSGRRLEFLGDSITAGFCNLCEEAPEANNAAAESGYDSWPRLIAQMAQAQFHAAAWSGYGLQHNCCGGTTTMPEVFSRTLASVSSAYDYYNNNAWAFGSWVPDALIVNLGTNDVSSGEYNETSFAAAYVDLCLNVSSLYASAAGGEGITLFLACGPMSDVYCGGVHLALDQLAALKTASATATASPHAKSRTATTERASQPLPRAAYFLDQTNVSSVSLNCCGHPSTSDDVAMATSSGAFIMNAMGWEN